MKGGEVDWARRGEEGFAQRWQVQSKKYTRANTTGWYTFRFKVAEDLDVPHYTLSFADFKRIIGKTDTGAPPISFSITTIDFYWVYLVQINNHARKEYQVQKNVITQKPTF